jgi:hypothetical protein
VAAIGVDRVLMVGGASAPDDAPATESTVRIVSVADGSVDVLAGTLPICDARVEPLGNGRFVVAGGDEGSPDARRASSRIAVVDPVDGVIASATLDVPRRDPALAVAAGNILVFGGRDGAGALTSAVERFRIAGTDLVHLGAPTPLLDPRAGAVALVTGEEVVVVGGETGDEAADGGAERFRFAIDGMEPADGPGVALPSPAFVELHDGTLLVVGGGAAVVYRP